MLFHLKTARQESFDTANAAIDVVHAITAVAEKVVVVICACPLVARDVARHLDDFQPPYVHQCVDVPVYSRYTDT
jgi:hypothetical protein